MGTGFGWFLIEKDGFFFNQPLRLRAGEVEESLCEELVDSFSPLFFRYVEGKR
jgi:hypothetical protein